MPDRPFPLAVDSTMLSTFRSCPRKYELQYLNHWKPLSDSVHLVAGKAFASGIEAARRAFYEADAPPEDAVAAGLQQLIIDYGDFSCPPESAKSLERTAGALEFYFENYPLGGDGAEPIRLENGARGIEFSFACPLSVSHPVSGDPILYTGRADMLAEAFNGIFVYDEKTTSSLGPSWSRQWDMRSQFTGYAWAAEQFGIKPNGICVRGVSILKTKYDTQQALTYRSDYEINRWLDQTCRDVERAIINWKQGYFDYNLDHACTEYGGCLFADTVCKSPDPQSWLDTQFTQRVWDPLLRTETTVEEYEATLPR